MGLWVASESERKTRPGMSTLMGGFWLSMVRIFRPVDYLLSLLVCAGSFWLTVYGDALAAPLLLGLTGAVLALLAAHIIWQRRTA